MNFCLLWHGTCISIITDTAHLCAGERISIDKLLIGEFE